MIHDDAYAGGLRTAGGLFVNDTFLKPEKRDVEADNLVYDGGHIFRRAEDIDEADVRNRRNGGGERGIRRFAERALDEGIDGHDAVAALLHEAGDAK